MDDRQENLDGAKRMGFKPIHFDLETLAYDEIDATLETIRAQVYHEALHGIYNTGR